MRTTFFFFAMLVNNVASATVTVTPISTNYSTNEVKFKVEWTNSPTAPYNNRVWIWIDFCPVNGVTPQSFSTATITNPTKISGSGTITGLNGRGFFIEYGATNDGTTVTAVLSNASGQFNWCAYGSDYPPNVLANTSGRYYTYTQRNGSWGGSSGYGTNKQGVCPNGWALPTLNNWDALYTSISSISSVIAERLRSLNSSCSPIRDYYGWSSTITVGCGVSVLYGDLYPANDSTGADCTVDHRHSFGLYCGDADKCGACTCAYIPVRCFRQL
jgi:hypothetical protein